MKLVSIIIPVYNGENHIRGAIESCLSQTYSNIEIIIINDNSKDNTEKIILEYKDERIRYIKNEINQGAAGNWNRGLDFAIGKYVKILCHDDILEKDCIEKQVAILDKYNNVSLVTSASEVILNGGKKISERRYFKEDGIYNGKEILTKALKDRKNYFGEPSICMWRNNHIRFFKNKYAPDFEFAIYQLLEGDLYYIDEVLSKFRLANNSGTSNLVKNIKKSIENILKEDRLQFKRLGEEYKEYASRKYKIKLISRFMARSLAVTFLKEDGQLIKYIAVGVFNTLISLITYFVLIYFKMNYIKANTIGYIIGLINSYILNKKIVFNHKGKTIKSAIYFLIINILSLLTSNGLLYIAIETLQMNKYISQIIISLMLIIINYVFNKTITFTSK